MIWPYLDTTKIWTLTDCDPDGTFTATTDSKRSSGLLSVTGWHGRPPCIGKRQKLDGDLRQTYPKMRPWISRSPTQFQIGNRHHARRALGPRTSNLLSKPKQPSLFTRIIAFSHLWRYRPWPSSWLILQDAPFRLEIRCGTLDP